ncbi:MAG: hypothetical protein LBH96_06750 [Candidatus Peribacteria bacterium]|jgi:flagellar basal body-associated protein FliL|nr:hypothetical protein [Candidatus Peribacteria bacterium]
MTNSKAKKIIIRIIVILFLISSGLTFVLYLMAPSDQPIQDDNQSVNIEEYIDLETTEVIIPNNENIDVNNPEDNEVQVVVTEDENQDEMSETVEVLLDDGTIDTPTVGDFTDTLQLSE